MTEQRVALSEIIGKLEAGVSVTAESRPASQTERGVLKVSSVTGGVFKPDENKLVGNATEMNRLAVSPRKGDIIMTRANGSKELVGCSVYVQADHPTLFLSDKLWRLSVKDDARDAPEWLFQVLNLDSVRREVIETASGSSGMRNISKQAFLKITVSRPPFVVQLKIASVLSEWDQAIELTQKLLAAKRRRKAALMQQLLTGKVRLSGFMGEWATARIEGFLTESRLPGSAGDSARKLTVKLYGKGVIPKADIRPGSSETRYYRRRAGQFIYSKLDFLNGAFGLIPSELDGYESTLDLPAFDVGEEVDPRWFLHFVTRKSFYKAGLSLANGGRKARRVNPQDFLKSEILLPNRQEQTAIADVIETAVKELDLLNRKLDALRQQKKGLMQQLLTGRVRVRVDDPPGG